MKKKKNIKLLVFFFILFFFFKHNKVINAAFRVREFLRTSITISPQPTRILRYLLLFLQILNPKQKWLSWGGKRTVAHAIKGLRTNEQYLRVWEKILSERFLDLLGVGAHLYWINYCSYSWAPHLSSLVIKSIYLKFISKTKPIRIKYYS